jgi:hypothetical protein
MNTTTLPRSDAVPAWHYILLAVGDALVLLAFAAIGRASHSLTDGNPLVATLLTASPFLATWAVVAPLMYVYGKGVQALNSAGWWLAHTALTWLVAGPLGLALRLVLFRRPFILIFMLVTMATVWLMMLVWRGVYWLVVKKLAA